MLGLSGLAVAIVTLSDVRTPTLVIDVDAIASDRSLERLVPDVLTCSRAVPQPYQPPAPYVPEAQGISLRSPRAARPRHLAEPGRTAGGLRRGRGV